MKDIKFIKTRDVKSPNRANQNDAGIDFFIPSATPEFINDFIKKNEGHTYKFACRMNLDDECVEDSITVYKTEDYGEISPYDILMSGIEEDYELNSEKRNVLRVLVHDTETNEDMTLIYDLARDLNICPKTMYNYYLYRFSPRNLRLGDAIRVVKEKVDENDKDHIIKLNNQNDDYLPIRIAFDMNEIIIGKETPNSIDFMKEWIDHPEEFKLYTINYQNNQHTVIAESLFAFDIRCCL